MAPLPITELHKSHSGQPLGNDEGPPTCADGVPGSEWPESEGDARYWAAEAMRWREQFLELKYGAGVSEAPPAVPQGHKAVPLKKLAKLAALIDPPPVEVDGKRMVFRNPMAAEVLTRLSAEVRELIEYRAPDAGVGGNDA